MNISSDVAQKYVEKVFVSKSPEDTHAIAASLLESLKPGSVLSLHGDLGSGKTCFIQGLAHALKIKQAVSSPTYTIINEYSGRLALYHVDLYRLAGVDDASSIGLEDYFDSDGITAVEWGERAEDIFPAHTIHVRFNLRSEQDSREIIILCPAFKI